MDHRRAEVLTEGLELLDVGTDHEHLIAGVALDQFPYDRQLCPRGGGEPVPLLGLGGGVGHALGVGECHAHLDALGRGDPAL